MKEILEALNRYDGEFLRAEYSNWENINAEERIAVLEGLHLLRDIGGLQKIEREHEQWMRATGAIAISRLMIACETNVGIREAIHQATLLASPPDAFQKSVLEFWIGEAFMIVGEFHLGKLFMEESAAKLSSLGMPALAWRSNLNAALCDLRIFEFNLFKKKMLELELTYSRLPLECQISFARFLIWLNLHMGEERRALAIIDENLARCPAGRLEFERGSLLKYGLYVLLRRRDSAGARKYLEELSVQDQQMKSLGTEMFFAATYGYKNIREFQDRLNQWKKSYNFIDLFYLADLTLQTRWGQGDADLRLSIQIFREIDRHISAFGYIIQPRDLRCFGLLFYLKSGHKHKFLTLMHDFQRSAHPAFVSQTRKILSRVELEQKRERIVIDVELWNLERSGKVISLSRSPSLQKFFFMLTADERSYSFDKISRSVFGLEFDDEIKQRILSLLFRARKVIGSPNIFRCSETGIALLAGYKVIRKGRVNEGRHYRRTTIMAYLAALSKKPVKKSASIGQLTRDLPFSRRAIQSELTHLVRIGKLVRSGERGRSVTYRARR